MMGEDELGQPEAMLGWVFVARHVLFNTAAIGCRLLVLRFV